MRERKQRERNDRENWIEKTGKKNVFGYNLE